MSNNHPPVYYASSEKEEKKSVFELWETGVAFNDSITPAAHIDHYREHIVRQIIGHSSEGKKILSLGCGNGFVEAQLNDAGYDVDAIDLHEDAVMLSCQKGVNAQVLDFYDLTGEDLENVGCIYADGFIGHLYSETAKFGPFLSHLKKILRGKKIHCVLSNDAPLATDLDVQRHEVVPDFWYISTEYLSDLLKEQGYEGIATQYYLYDRPISGQRRRMIVSFTANGN